MTATPPPSEVAAYLSKVPEPKLSALLHIRDLIRAVAPDAQEVITYAMPGFAQDGGLLAYAAFKNHCSIFPMGGIADPEIAELVAPWRTSKGTLQFTPDTPIPDAVLRKLVLKRLAENARKAQLKRAGKASRK